MKSSNDTMVIAIILIIIAVAVGFKFGLFSILGPTHNVQRDIAVGYPYTEQCHVNIPSGDNQLVIGTNTFTSFNFMQPQIYPKHQIGESCCGVTCTCLTLEQCQQMGYAQDTCDYYCPVNINYNGQVLTTNFQNDSINGGTFSLKNGQIVLTMPKLGAMFSGGPSCGSIQCSTIDWTVNPNVNMYIQNPISQINLNDVYTPVLIIDDTFGIGSANLTINEVPGTTETIGLNLVNGVNTITLPSLSYTNVGTKAVSYTLSFAVNNRQKSNYNLETIYYDNQIIPSLSIEVLESGAVTPTNNSQPTVTQPPVQCTTNSQCSTNFICQNNICVSQQQVNNNQQSNPINMLNPSTPSTGTSSGVPSWVWMVGIAILVIGVIVVLIKK